jgi:hypothetical protein
MIADVDDRRIGLRARAGPVGRTVTSSHTGVWRWCRTGPVPLDTSPTHAILPSALTVRRWLERTRQRTAAER